MKIINVFVIFISMSFISNVRADFASHQYHYMEMELSECIKIASESAKKFKFNMAKRRFNSSKYLYSSISGMNNEGYSFQYLCESRKGFAYLIINGPRSDKRNEIRDNLGNEIKMRAKNFK